MGEHDLKDWIATRIRSVLDLLHDLSEGNFIMGQRVEDRSTHTQL